jgi:hypothetical protein
MIDSQAGLLQVVGASNLSGQFVGLSETGNKIIAIMAITYLFYKNLGFDVTDEIRIGKLSIRYCKKHR